MANNKIKKEANLRDDYNQSQCTLSFHLDYKKDGFGHINEEIHAVRQVYETVQSLFEHIQNKIIFIIKNNLKQLNDEREMVVIPDIPLALMTGKRKLINELVVLKDLFNYEQLHFSIFKIKYIVLINAPTITVLKLPAILYAGHIIQPAALKTTHTEFKLCEYFWYISKNKKDWFEVGNNYNYLIKNEEVENYIKFKMLPKNSKKGGHQVEIISDNVIQNVPKIPICPFEDRHKYTTNKLEGIEFRIVSYNVLSMCYTNSQFEYCNPEYLNIHYRKQVTLKELIGYNSDIICLQEVDSSVFSFYYRDQFKKLGYGSIFNKKGNVKSEGLAIFYNKQRFAFAGQGQIVFKTEVKTNNIFRNIWSILQKSKSIADIFLKQVTSMQFCKLKLIDSNKMIIVANTHLYYHPDANLVRKLQIATCLDYLQYLLKKEKKNNKCLQISVIFCGDYNSQPESDVIKYVTEGAIEYNDDIDFATTLFHSFEFESACGMPEFSNYTSDFKATLDYIFYEKNVLSVTKFVPFPNEEILAQDVALPSKVFPSDHLALITDFKFN